MADPITPDEYFRQQREQAADAARRSALIVSQPLDKTPDEYARAAALAKSVNLPTAVIEPSIDTFQQRMLEKRNELLLSTAPKLTQWVAKDDNYRVAADDIEGLSWWESLAIVPRGIASAVPAFNEGAWGLAAAAAKLPGRNPVSDYLERLARQSRQTKEAVAGPTGGWLGQQVQGASQSIGMMLPGIAASIASGGAAAPAVAAAYIAPGAISQGGSSAQRALDKGLPATQALQYGLQDAAAEAIFEKMPVGRLLNDISKGTGFGKLLARQMAVEVPTEIATTIYQNLNEYANLTPDKPFGDFLAEQPAAIRDTIVQTVLATSAVSAGGRAASRIVERSLRDQERARQAGENQQTIADMSSAAQGSVLRNRLPDSFKEYLDEALADGPVENVYVPAQDFVEYFQGQGIDPFDLTDDFGMSRDELDAALAGGGDLRIPTSTYASKIAGSEADAFFMENMRFSPDAMTAREAAEFNERAADAMQEAWEEAERIRTQEEALRGVEERIYSEMQSRLRAAGRTTDVANAEATLYPAFYRVMAERSGMTTEEFLGKYPLPRVEGVRPEGMQTKDVTAFNRTLAEARRPRRKVNKGQSLLEFIAERGGINDPGGELRARDAQVVKRGRGKKSLRLARDTSGDGQASMLPGGRAGIGYGVDDVAQAAIEAGFMADNPVVLEYRAAMENGTEVPDLTRALWDAIDAELRGEPQYSADVQDDGAEETNVMLDQVEAYLSSLGVSLDDSDADILAAVRADEEGQRYGQGDRAADQPLYVVHNLSAEKLKHVADLGGLAAPSLAVARGDIGFDNFGEISLIGDPSLANPKAKGVRLFSADVYSPRQPRARFKVNEKARRAMRSLLAPAAEKIGLEIDRQRIGQDDIERGGLSEVEMTDAAKAAWLEAKGEVLPIVYQEAKAPEAPAGLGNFTATDEAELLADPAFMARMQRKYELALKRAEGNADLTARINEAWLGDDGAVSPDAIPARNLARQVAEYNRTIAGFKPGKTDKIDSYRTSEALTAAIGDRMQEYREWVRAQFGDVVGPAFFENEAGRKREYTLANLVREMTRTIRNGENWNYGAGNVRAAVAPEFKALAEVKDARGQITSDAEMEALKDEVNAELFALADKFAPYHSSGQDFGWADIFTDFLKDVAKGERAVQQWQTQWFSSPAPDELIDEARAFLEKLKGLPTNYFEIKMQRAMTLDEFTAALVPSDVSADARATLTAAGLEIVEYDRNADGGRSAALASIGDRVFFQNNGTGPRGSVQFPAAGVGNGDTIIRLSQRADLSTFLHESGHYFLTVLQDMAAKGEPAAVVEFAAIKAWWRENAQGVAADARKAFPELAITADHVRAAIDTGTSGDAAIDAAIDVGMQEQWARGFEQYVMEGKAPSVELRSAFERFRAWLLSIYRKLAGLNVNVSDDLLRVFDRMLATDEEIANAQAEAGDGAALFATAEEMGLTDDEFERFQKLRAQAEEEAKARLLAETMAPIRREREKWYREERANVRATVEPRINARPEYRAIEWMGNRRWLGEDQPVGMADMRLSKSVLVARYGEGILKTLPRGKYPVYTVEGGINPDDAAGWFGFGSGDEMLQAMEKAQPRKEAIEAEVDRIMYETHGDVLRDGSVEEKALDAVHGDQRARVLALELDALNRKIGKDQPTRARQVKEIARRTISRMKVRDAMAANRFLAAERKASTAAYRAVAEGNIEEAAAQKYRQLLNHALYSEARAVSEEVAKAERFVASLNKASKREKIAGAGRREDAQIDYLAAIDEILDRYDFRRMSGRAEDRRGSLLAFVEAMRAAGRENELAIPDDVLANAKRTPYKTIPVEELRGVVDSLKNLEHVALRWNKLIDAQRRRDFDASVGDVVSEFVANIDRRPPGRVGTMGESVSKAKRQFLDLVLNATTILREIDGFKDFGGAYENIKRPIDDAMNRLIIRKEKAATDLDALYSVYSKDERRAMAVRTFMPELGFSLSKWEMLSVALNTGNDGNYQRLTDPRVSGSLTPEQVDAVLGKLDERDAAFVQSVWDYVGSFREDIAAREKRTTGVEPEWVEAKPIEIAGKMLRGGYYPLKYDPRLSSLARDDAENEIWQSMQAGRFGKAQTRNGHLQSRAQLSGRAIELDMSVLHRHVNQVVYDLELSEPVANSWRLLQAAPVRDQFIQTGRQADFEALEAWLLDVGQGEIRSGDLVGKMARTMKSNFTASKLAFNLSTVAMQVTGLSQTMVVVGKKDFARGLSAALRPGVTDEIVAKSPYMTTRQTTFNKDIYDFYSDPKTGPVASRWGEIKSEIIGPASFWLMTKVQWYLVDVPTWMAGYQQGLRRFGGDENRAIQHADDIVKRAQASGLFSDRSAIERGSVSRTARQNDVVRLFTTLGSYMFAKFNVAYERSARAGQTFRREGVSLASAQEVLSLTLDMAFLFALEAVIVAAIKGRLPDDDDEEDKGWLAFLGKETAFGVMGTIPFVRDIASTMGGFEGGGAYGAITKEVAQPFKEIAQGQVDKGLIKSVINGTGLATGLPATQINRMFDAAWRASEGEEVAPMEYLLGKSGK